MRIRDVQRVRPALRQKDIDGDAFLPERSVSLSDDAACLSECCIRQGLGSFVPAYVDGGCTERLTDKDRDGSAARLSCSLKERVEEGVDIAVIKPLQRLPFRHAGKRDALLLQGKSLLRQHGIECLVSGMDRSVEDRDIVRYVCSGIAVHIRHCILEPPQHRMPDVMHLGIDVFDALPGQLALLFALLRLAALEGKLASQLVSGQKDIEESEHIDTGKDVEEPEKDDGTKILPLCCQALDHEVESYD